VAWVWSGTDYANLTLPIRVDEVNRREDIPVKVNGTYVAVTDVFSCHIDFLSFTILEREAVKPPRVD
jgi:hypothetical protein